MKTCRRALAVLLAMLMVASFGFSAVAVTDDSVHTATFMADGEIVEAVPFKLLGDEPEVPEKEGYYGYWESYTLGDEDITINAVYSPIAYFATFVADGSVVERVQFNVETKDSVEAPAVPEKAGYTGEWEEYELELADITINAIYTAEEYTITFVADGETVSTQTFTAETIDDIEVPEVPEKEGFYGYWEDYEISFNDLTVNAKYDEIHGYVAVPSYQKAYRNFNVVVIVEGFDVPEGSEVVLMDKYDNILAQGTGELKYELPDRITKEQDFKAAVIDEEGNIDEASTTYFTVGVKKGIISNIISFIMRLFGHDTVYMRPGYYYY